VAERRTVRSLGVEAPGRVRLWSYEEGPLEEGRFRVETLYSGFSAGTELTLVKGTNPYLGARWDPEFCVFVPDEPSARYPVPFLGYMEVGRVAESRTPAVGEGAVVAMAYGHKTGHVADARRELFFLLPPDLDPMLGVYVAQMGPICANGVLHAAAELVGADVRDLGDGVRGRNVLVTGGGVVGLLTALFARRAGAAEVVVADPSPFRRERARALGLEAEDEAEVWRVCKERWSHGGSDRGADVAFQCRARPASLHGALRALRPQGAVIDLAFYQGGAGELRLGEEFHHNGLTVRCAQIGRVPRGTGPAWGRRRLAAETVGLLREQGPALREHLITDVVRFEDAPGFVGELVTRRRDFLQIVFEAA
jgi:threonine dehydrogenase-like Zn-dependent dehydrogenase